MADDDPRFTKFQTDPMTDMSVDYARGEGLASDSSSEDDDSSDDDEPGPPSGSHGSDPSPQAEEVFDKWGELDHDAPRTESISARLAVCNMDWDRVGAEDLFLAMASFCPSSGRVRSGWRNSEFGSGRNSGKMKRKSRRRIERCCPERDNPRDNGQEEDDVPSDVDLDDPFFRSELAEGNASDSETEIPMPKKKSKKALKKDKKAKAVKANEENGADGETRADLGLLVMDSDDEKGHFDYKDIVEREKGKKAKKGRKRKNPEEKQPVAEDVFEMDLQDDRFAAVFHNADFNVDPSHPSFKKTKSMQQVINEKQRRILQSDSLVAKSPKLSFQNSHPISYIHDHQVQTERTSGCVSEGHQGQNARSENHKQKGQQEKKSFLSDSGNTFFNWDKYLVNLMYFPSCKSLF
ncbi:hypothetical protein TCAL_16850 [Tigriopus californicus]|uniref:Uncharacterized protein n=1 Tax=Tigriopus californicus TaxID=6832 RepID=A0A553PBR5_TIGCA|nr:hypothetical protein TCAL_16850 [Tigriopus californicus]